MKKLVEAGRRLWAALVPLAVRRGRHLHDLHGRDAASPHPGARGPVVHVPFWLFDHRRPWWAADPTR